MKVAALLIAEIDAIRVAVDGEPLLAHAVRGLADAGCVDQLVIVAPPEADLAVPTVAGLPWQLLTAAATRAESIRLACAAAGSYDVVLLHDAARPFVPSTTIRTVVEAVAQGADAVAPVLPVTDTVKLTGAGGVITATEDRTRLRTLQTPLGFRRTVLDAACASGIDPMSAPPGTVRTVAGHPNALRLATPFDVAVAEALLAETSASASRGQDRNGTR